MWKARPVILLLSFVLCVGAVLATPGKKITLDITIRNFQPTSQVDILACYQEPDITWALGKLHRIDNCIDSNKTREVKLKKNKLTALLDIHYEALPPMICGVFSVKDKDGKTEFPDVQCIPFSKKGDPVSELELDAEKHTIEADY